MATCPNCGRWVRAGDSICMFCGHKDDFEEIEKREKARYAELFRQKEAENAEAKVEADRANSAILGIPVVTLPYLPNRKVKSIVGIVTAKVGIDPVEATWSVNSFRTAVAASEETVLKEMKRIALELGCDAVLGAHSELTQVFGYAMLVMTGTGVTLEGEEQPC
ncbi:MAG: hypothetical protein ACM3WU_02950 [Bacillota bacterium]